MAFSVHLGTPAKQQQRKLYPLFRLHYKSPYFSFCKMMMIIIIMNIIQRERHTHSPAESEIIWKRNKLCVLCLLIKACHFYFRSFTSSKRATRELSKTSKLHLLVWVTPTLWKHEQQLYHFNIKWASTKTTAFSLNSLMWLNCSSFVSCIIRKPTGFAFFFDGKQHGKRVDLLSAPFNIQQLTQRHYWLHATIFIYYVAFSHRHAFLTGILKWQKADWKLNNLF